VPGRAAFPDFGPDGQIDGIACALCHGERRISAFRSRFHNAHRLSLETAMRAADNARVTRRTIRRNEHEIAARY
jgi:hypothetical protein